MKPTPKTPMPIAPSMRNNQSNIDVQEQIRLRAYQLYEQRGSEHGCDLDDWLRAEAEMTQQKTKLVAA